MIKAFQQSIKALRANKGRTVLTMLGIIIGISTVILVLSAGEGFRSLIDSELANFGTNTIFIQVRVPPTTKNKANANSQSASNAAFSGSMITSLKQRDLDDIKKLPNVSNAYGIITGQAVGVYRNNKRNTIYYGA